jgi:hypothetical protein
MSLRLHIPLPGPFSISGSVFKRSRPKPLPLPMLGIMAWFFAIVYASPFWSVPLALGLFLVTLRLRELFAEYPRPEPSEARDRYPTVSKRKKFGAILVSLDAFFTLSLFFFVGVFIFYLAVIK